MNEIKTGGPAFPCPRYFKGIGPDGMTLRDYFAAKAMQSMNSRQDYLDAPASAIALDAYALADAMLKVRDVE
jgi:hypothetical protein